MNMGLWVVLALMWSSAFLAIKVAVPTVAPLVIVACRMVIGTGIVLLVFALARKSFPRDGRSWLVMGIAGLLGNIIPFTLIGYGEQHVDSGLAALLMGIAPVVTVLFAPLFDQEEHLTGRVLVGVALGLAGLVVLFGPAILRDLGRDLLGQGAILGAALCYAFTSLFLRRFNRLDPLTTTAGSMTVGTLCVGTLVLAQQGGGGFTPDDPAVWAILYLGVVPTALAMLIYFHLLPRIGAPRLTQINFVVPVVGSLLGMLVLRESPGPTVLLALPLIVAAVGLVVFRPAAQGKP
jgi:drug/metabolite transporter (DMT)-like permease